MKTFTLKEFKKLYPNDSACLEKLFKLRYGHLEACPKCACVAEWRRVRTRQCYQCRHCYEQFYPKAGTIFEKSRTPLSSWFFVMFLFTTTRNGVAAHEIARQLGCTIKTAWRIGHQVRKLMDKLGMDKLKGFVEMDETYFSKPDSEIKDEDKYKQKVSTPVFGMVQRTGEVRAFRVDDTTKDSIFPLILKYVDRAAIVSTDEHHLYKNLNRDFSYVHGTINHGDKEYRNGVYCTNTIEGFFGQLKRMVGGTHIHVSEKYLQNYVSECVFRYNMRKKQKVMFETILSHLPLIQSPL
jgi:transposase